MAVCGRFVAAASLSNGYPIGVKLPLLSMNGRVIAAQVVRAYERVKEEVQGGGESLSTPLLHVTR